jgi:hypothetical protein
VLSGTSQCRTVLVTLLLGNWEGIPCEISAFVVIIVVYGGVTPCNLWIMGCDTV